MLVLLQNVHTQYTAQPLRKYTELHWHEKTFIKKEKQYTKLNIQVLTEFIEVSFLRKYDLPKCWSNKTKTYTKHKYLVIHYNFIYGKKCLCKNESTIKIYKMYG